MIIKKISKIKDLKTQIIPVILCGGSGSRLWPLSRAGFPKQFLNLTDKETLFQNTIKRLNLLNKDNHELTHKIIVAGEDHRFIVSEQLREIGDTSSQIILEPETKNTAPALTSAALIACTRNSNPVLIVTPADHTIKLTKEFVQTLEIAIKEANNGSIVTLGVTPSRPETGYGYIEIDDFKKSDFFTIKRFVEKPDEITAKSYCDKSNFFWNAGIFILKASTWLDAISKLRPNILEISHNAWKKPKKDGNFIRPLNKIFKSIPSESIDYAVMENASNYGFTIKMVPLNAGWNDLGAWNSVWEAVKKDHQGNAHFGDVLSIRSKNTLVKSTTRLVSLVGVKDLIIIETSDSILVTNLSNSQDVKEITKTLNKKNRYESLLHRKVHRPWGWYDSVDHGNRFKVKRIHVKPRASLSLQKHNHRAEHWVVVRGIAEITNGDKVTILKENQSTYIPLGEVHRLANPGKYPLEIIEVQSGSYLGEDDIIRFRDEYGRDK